MINSKQKEGKTTTAEKVIDTISGIFVPIINVLMAAALLKGLLIVLLNTGVLAKTDGTYQVLFAIADGFFYFMPVFLAYTAANKMKADPFVSVLIGATLVYPALTTLFQSGVGTDFLGLPINPVIYPSSVVPIILAVGLLHFVELPLERFLPGAVKGFLKPMISLFVVVPITLWVFGPLGMTIGTVLAGVFDSIYSYSPIVAGIIFGFLWQPMVVFGMQWALVPVILEHIRTLGYDMILPLLGAAVTAQAGAAMTVSFLTKNKKFKPVAMSGAITAILGVTEPVLYGVTIPLKRPMLAACIAGAIGGGIVGAAGSRAISFAFPSVLSLIVYLGEGFWTFFISLPIGFVLGVIFTLLLRFKDSDVPKEYRVEQDPQIISE